MPHIAHIQSFQKQYQGSNIKIFQRINESIEFKFNQSPILTFDFFSCNNYAMSMSNISGLILDTVSHHSVRLDSNVNRYTNACMQNLFIHLICLLASCIGLYFFYSFIPNLSPRFLTIITTHQLAFDDT